MRMDRPSLTVMLSHTPFVPHHPGNTNRNGMSSSNWRLSERKMLFLAIPMLWKKLPVTIWKPMNGAMS